MNSEFTKLIIIDLSILKKVNFILPSRSQCLITEIFYNQNYLFHIKR